MFSYSDSKMTTSSLHKGVCWNIAVDKQAENTLLGGIYCSENYDSFTPPSAKTDALRDFWLFSCDFIFGGLLTIVSMLFCCLHKH